MFHELPARLARVLTDAGPRLAAWDQEHWLALQPGVPDIVSVTAADFTVARRVGERLAGPLRFLPPVMPGKIVGVGLNYRSHAEEGGHAIPDHPLIFSKFVTTLIGDGDPIVVDEAVTRAADWEVELAVIVGRRLRRASRAEALQAVFGYTVANDVTARDIQSEDVQWTRAKCLDSFCPLGPWVVPASGVDPQNLRLRSWVNGVLMQDGSTSDMIFDVGTLLSFCSWNFLLSPGDVLLTGTPPGVGAFRDPPVFLKQDDRVEVEVETIGRLSNTVTVVRSGPDA